MKLLITTGLYPPEIGGPATYSKLLADELPKRGIAVDVLPFREVRHLPKVMRHVAYFFEVIKKGKSADVIFAQDPVSVGLPTVCAAKLLRKPFLIRIAGDYAWEQALQRYGVTDGIDVFQKQTYGACVEVLRKVQQFVVHRADQIVTPSGYFNKLVEGWGARRVTTIYNGITFPELPVAAPYEQREKIIISAGRLVPWKGFAGLIALLSDMPEWRLAIMGDGPDRERLEQLAREQQVSDRVLFLGSVPRERLFKELQKARVFILNTSFESFSFQVVEVMYAGTPVITTNIGSLPEIVEDQCSGVLVAPDDKEAMKKALERVDTNVAFREEIVRNAQKRSQTFSLENTLRQLIALLQDRKK